MVYYYTGIIITSIKFQSHQKCLLLETRKF